MIAWVHKQKTSKKKLNFFFQFAKTYQNTSFKPDKNIKNVIVNLKMQIKLRSILKTKVVIFMPRSLPEIASIQIAGFLDKKFLRLKLLELTTIFF